MRHPSSRPAEAPSVTPAALRPASALPVPRPRLLAALLAAVLSTAGALAPSAAPEPAPPPTEAPVRSATEPGTAAGKGSPAARPEPAAPPGMARYWVGLIRRGEAWTPEPTEETARVQQAHMANIRRLAAEGKLVMAGPFADGGDLRGLFFYDVPTREEAEALVATDPAVAAGRLQVDLHPWWGPQALRDVLERNEAGADGDPEDEEPTED